MAERSHRHAVAEPDAELGTEHTQEPGKQTQVAAAYGMTSDPTKSAPEVVELRRQVRRFEISVDAQEALHLETKNLRDEYFIVAATSEVAAEAKEALSGLWARLTGKPKVQHIDEDVELPPLAMWQRVRASIEQARQAIGKLERKPGDPVIRDEIQRAVAAAKLEFEHCHRRLDEYRTRAIEGAETSQETLETVVTICAMIEMIASGGLAAGAGAGLVASSAAGAAAAGGSKLVFGAAQRGSEVAHGTRDDFGLGELLAEAATETAAGFAMSFVGGKLSQKFLPLLARRLAAVAPSSISAMISKLGGAELAASGKPGAKLLAEAMLAARDVMTEVISTVAAAPLSTAVNAVGKRIRTGAPVTAEQFLDQVLDDMFAAGVASLIVGGITRGRTAITRAKQQGEPAGTGTGHEPAGQPTPEPQLRAEPPTAPTGGQGGPIRQVTSNLDELYVHAEAAQQALTAATNKISAAVGATPDIPPNLKGRPRALQKINADYGGDASQIVDLARSSIVCDTVEQVNLAAKLLKEQFPVARIKDRFARPSDGYRDMLFNLTMPNGHIVEVQVHLKAVKAAKDNGMGHKLFEQLRDIEAAIKLENRPATAAETTKIKELKAGMKTVYDQAYVAAGGEL
ncbi:MAG: RelA/SpoT domain-containing protein [Kofleriaceae bacterium]